MTDLPDPSRAVHPRLVGVVSGGVPHPNAQRVAKRAFWFLVASNGIERAGWGDLTGTDLEHIADVLDDDEIFLPVREHDGVRLGNTADVDIEPTDAAVDMLVENVGGYVAVIIDRTFAVGATDAAEKEWAKSWTIFYWGWWIAWCPFVGMFVARISRGRTIRELVLGVLLVPTAVTILWFSVFGGTALHLELAGKDIAGAVSSDVATAIYVTLEQLPIPEITSMLAACVVAVFFVTSSDSASFVVDMLTSGGHPDPPVWQRVFWATAEGTCAAVLLYAGGKKALDALQAAVVSIGLPFCVLLLALVYGLIKALRAEPAKVVTPQQKAAPEAE